MFLLLAGLGLADDATCQACCRAGGLDGCATEVHVRTEGSSLSPSGMDTRVQGGWVLKCDGSGYFDPSLVEEVDHEPAYAEVLGSGLNPLALHCFVQACALPERLCVGAANLNGDVQLVSCVDGLPASQPQLAAAPRRPTSVAAMVVVIDGRPLVAESGETVVHGPPGVAASVATRPLPPPPGAPPPGLAPAATPPSAPAPAVLALPDDPPDPCTPAPDAVRAEARKRVGTGDDLRIAGRVDEALRDYKAALTLDRCNGYAWMSIAQLAADAGRTDLVIRALKNTTRLVPRHPAAWMMLAKGYEGFGQRAMAHAAWQTATELAPGNAEAIEGYMRTR